MDITEAQQRYNAAVSAYSLAQGEVYAADRDKQSVDRDLRCGVIQADNPSIAAIDKVFCAARLTMAQARDDLAAAERRLAEAEREAQRGPTPFERKLKVVKVHDTALYQRYQREVEAVNEAHVNDKDRARYILANTKSMILRFQVPEEVSAS